MSLIRWQPLRELDNLRQQMNHLFEQLIHTERHQSLFPKMTNVAWMPTIELQETDADIILKAQVPGVDAKDIDIQVSSDAVLIAGEHKEETRTEDKGIFRSEFQYGQFQRVVPLPQYVKYEQVKAEFKDGVVTLTLPLAEANRRNVVKVDLTMQEKAREAMAGERKHTEHLQQTMHARTAAGLETQTSNDVQEEAREIMTQQRMHDEHLEETMHSLAAEAGVTGRTTNVG